MSLPVANAQTHEVMAGWSSGKPVAALMGEFSSGKSTLLNFLLGEEVATTKVTATPLPPIWFTHSETEFVTALRQDGSEVEVELGDPAVNYRENYLAIRVGHPSDALKACDIIDTPGLSDPDLAKDALRFLYRYFSFAIWCTAAAQAWRQTEKATYEKLAARTKENSILVITRADKLRFEKDEAKVFKRVHGETHEMFGEVVVLKTPKAAAVPLDERTDEEDGAWIESGGFAFSSALEKAVSACLTASQKPSAKPKTKAKKPAKAKKKTHQIAETSEVSVRASEGETMPGNSQDLIKNEHSIAAIGCESSSHKLGTVAQDKTSRTGTSDVDIESSKPPSDDDFTPSIASDLASASTSSSAPTEPAQLGETDSSQPQKTTAKENPMASTDISNLSDITGFIGACLVDTETGLMMASEGGKNFDLETAGAANVEVVKAKMNAMKMLELDENIDDILITLGSQFHLIRPLADTPSVFLYTALDKKAANLGMARVQVKKVESSLEL
ncbi:MAG: dynamin family protein [Litoreibacter sp.]|nr:dynamin family protein [Litoreibacter sp.]